MLILHLKLITFHIINLKNMGKPLSPDLIMMRSKCDRLDMVKNLNLWGNDISDVSVLSSLPNLEILSLSVNKIQSLNDF